MDGDGPVFVGSAEATVGFRMAEACPKLVDEIDRLLLLDDPAHPLAGTVGDLRYHGRCPCTTTCGNLLTAPPASAGPYIAQLERDGVDVIWLSLDPDCSIVVDIEVLDPTGLDLDLEPQHPAGSRPTFRHLIGCAHMPPLVRGRGGGDRGWSRTVIGSPWPTLPVLPMSGW